MLQQSNTSYFIFRPTLIILLISHLSKYFQVNCLLVRCNILLSIFPLLNFEVKISKSASRAHYADPFKYIQCYFYTLHGCRSHKQSSGAVARAPRGSPVLVALAMSGTQKSRIQRLPLRTPLSSSPFSHWLAAH
jgi:hypothetical protein